jgi:hypothetical protein
MPSQPAKEIGGWVGVRSFQMRPATSTLVLAAERWPSTWTYLYLDAAILHAIN